MKRSKFLAINALLTTVIIIFTLIPIRIGPVSLAFLVLIPIIVSAQAVGFKSSIYTGALFGILSFISSFLIPSPLAPMFNNPLISILPRLFVGVSGYFAYKIMLKATKKIKNEVFRLGISSCVSAIISVLVNTGLVLSMMWALFNGKDIAGTAIDAKFMSALLSTNFIIEVICCALLAPSINYALVKSKLSMINQ